MKLAAWVRARRRRTVVTGTAAMGGVVVLTVILVMSGIAPDGLRPSPTDGPSGTSAPATPPPGNWTSLHLAPYEPVADLIPEAADASGIDPAGSFTLRSLSGMPALDLAAGLRSEPAVELRVAAGLTPDTATVTPASPLVAGARYRFELRSAEGSLLAQWSFRTGGPLHVVRLLPADRTTQVPVNTGIEVEFDQDGVTGVESHMTIDPTVPGHTEQHGRTWAFVPDADLAIDTLYTVVVSRGVGMSGSDQVLESDVRFQFETAGQSTDLQEPVIVFPKPIQEAQPGATPVLQIDVWGPYSEDQTIRGTADVYQLATLEQALEAAGTLGVDRSWARWSSTGNVTTESLSKVASLDVSVQANSDRLIELPISLSEGWYLVNVPQAGRDGQAMLQVTDLAVYALTSTTRTVLWANDLATGGAVEGARVSLGTGAQVGVTDGAGLMDVATPNSLRRAAVAPEVLLVASSDGRHVLAPLRRDGSAFAPFGARTDWWLLFQTDRLQYRQDDTIHAWGVVRSRADRSVPEDIELRLVAGYATGTPPIATNRMDATDRGVFVGDVAFQDLPLGWYSLALFVAGEQVTSVSLQVTEIRKPAFRLEVSTDRRAYVRGDDVSVRAVARFYDGSLAPSLSLRMRASGVTEDAERIIKVDGSGAARLTLVAANTDRQLGQGNVGVSPATPEEGTSYGDTGFVVFPSEAWLTAEATGADGVVSIAGHLTRVDFARAESQLALDGWVSDPSGAPIRGGRVNVQVVHVTWTARTVGTTYDFLQKKRVPLIQYQRHVETVGSFAATSDSRGAFALDVPVGATSGSYEIRLTAADDDNREVDLALSASASDAGLGPPSRFPYLTASTADAPPESFVAADVGETVDLTVREADGALSGEAPTLFIVARRGIDQVVVRTDGAMQREFTEADVPSLTVRGVQLTLSGYLVTNDVQVGVNPRQKTIEVAIVPDQESYAPGEKATLSITTVGPDAVPIAADVLVQAVDQKLFAIGAAREIDIGSLMSPTGSGFLSSYASHRVNPGSPWGDGFGAATGGGDRADFKDLATFQLVSTNAAGRATVAFELPDDLTSWHVSAGAIAAGLESGATAIEIPATLPLFVDATIASEYLSGEQAEIQLRAYGDSLSEGDAVRFTVEAPSIGLARTTVDGRAFDAVRLALPELSLGDHRLRIAVERVGSDPVVRDAVIRTIHVVPTRLRSLLTAYEPMSDGYAPPGGDGLTTYVITDAGRGALLPVLQQLASNGTARFDASLAADLARTLLVEEFGISDSSLPPSGYDPARGQTGSLRLLPYDSPDLFLSASTALVASERVDRAALRDALRAWAAEATATRERRIVALAGLAALGDEVAGDLRGLAEEELTVRERLWSALGLLAAGDVDAARSLERSILEEHGRRLGQWVRIEAGNAAAEGIDATGLMLLLAAGLGDAIAAELSKYLLDNPSPEQIVPLEQLGYVRAAMEWLPREAASFSWTVDGERHVEELEAGGSFAMTLTAAQRRSLVLEPVHGALAVAASWTGPARYGDLPSDRLVSIERTVSPAGNAASDQLVRVSLKVTVARNAPEGCYQVTDLLPSGLAPLAYPHGAEEGVIAPYEVVGQRVSWCIDAETVRTRELGYTAHVVSAGTYRWEPAVIQSLAAPSVGAATEPATYTIR